MAFMKEFPGKAFFRTIHTLPLIMAPIIVMICSIGVYSLKNDVDDVLMMFIFGVVGYLLRKFKFELGPLLLAFVLGRILERSLSQALIISSGKFSVFVTKPISAVLLGLVLLMLLIPLILMLRGKRPEKAA